MLISLMAFDLMAGCDHRRSRSVCIGSVIGCRIACDVQYEARAFPLIRLAARDASYAITTVQIFISLFKKRFALATEKCFPRQYVGARVLADSF